MYFSPVLFSNSSGQHIQHIMWEIAATYQRVALFYCGCCLVTPVVSLSEPDSHDVMLCPGLICQWDSNNNKNSPFGDFMNPEKKKKKMGHNF